jgi:hypothetical protein
MAANQYRDEAYARAHAARQQQMQMAVQNGLGQIQQYYANEFKRNQFNRMMELYWAEHNANHPKRSEDTNINPAVRTSAEKSIQAMRNNITPLR